MKWRVAVTILAVLLLVVPTPAAPTLTSSGIDERTEAAKSSRGSFRGELSGAQEVPPISTAASGECRLRIDTRAGEIHYTVRYEGLEGNVTQSHAHFGQPGVAGGIMIFFCSNLGNGPAGTPLCPPSPGEVEGTLVASEVVGPAAQGITAGEFEAVVAAIRDGTAYANVHTNLFPAGEIRGQLR